MKSRTAMLAFITVAVGLSMGAESVGAQGGTFTSTAGSMTSPRALQRATRLVDGRVLITGGIEERGAPGNVGTAEIFNPGAGTFSPLGSQIAARTFHRATLLWDGSVLITGGDNRGGGGSTISSAEIFDPTLGTFTATGSLTTERAGHTATRLQDGRVLITGGRMGRTFLSSAELFDPTGTFSVTTGPMAEARHRHTATLLEDGTVLVAGGIVATGLLSTAEIFNPTSGTFSSTEGPMTKPRGDDHTASLLQDGTVLLVGGLRGDPPFFAQPSVDLYDPITKTFRETAFPMAGPRNFHSATLLSDGTVLIAGGRIETAGTTFRAAIYDPGTETFTETAPDHMTTEREFHTATVLGDGAVLITGGFKPGLSLLPVVQSSAEIFTP